MREIDWDEVELILRGLIDRIDEASTELCTKKFLRGCSVIQGQVLPPLEDLLEEVKRAGKASSGLMAGLFGGEEEEEEEEVRLPERGYGLEAGTAGERRAGIPRTEEERRIRHKELFEEEL